MLQAVAAILIAAPGVLGIARCYPLKTHLTQISDRISVSAYSDLLDEIPSGKYVFSSDPFKGDYDGYFTPDNWHGTAWKKAIQKLGISKEEYIGNFNYYICNMDSTEEIELLNSCTAQGLTLQPLKKCGNYTLYGIRTANKEVLDTVLPAPVQSLLSAPVTEAFAVSGDHYVITQDVENTDAENEEVRFQINWMDANGDFLSTSITTYTVLAGERNEATSQEISAPTGAGTGILYVGPCEDKPITVYSYSLESVSDSGYIKEVANAVNTRLLLRNN